jgi:hypothetical protein
VKAVKVTNEEMSEILAKGKANLGGDFSCGMPGDTITVVSPDRRRNQVTVECTQVDKVGKEYKWNSLVVLGETK